MARTPFCSQVPFRRNRYLVRLCEVCALGGGFATDQAFACEAVVGERDRAAGCLGFFADSGFAHWIPAPIDVGESAAALCFHVFAEYRVVVELPRIRGHRSSRLRVEALLNLAEQGADRVGDGRERGL